MANTTTKSMTSVAVMERATANIGSVLPLVFIPNCAAADIGPKIAQKREMLACVMKVSHVKEM